ncbi:hypothetical protein GW17_00033547 [Ensete ventricosum]|nr:hypothetical protein GW17_00033547 [Ensete ventricosum]
MIGGRWRRKKGLDTRGAPPPAAPSFRLPPAASTAPPRGSPPKPQDQRFPEAKAAAKSAKWLEVDGIGVRSNSPRPIDGIKWSRSWRKRVASSSSLQLPMGSQQTAGGGYGHFPVSSPNLSSLPVRIEMTPRACSLNQAQISFSFHLPSEFKTQNTAAALVLGGFMAEWRRVPPKTKLLIMIRRRL